MNDSRFTNRELQVIQLLLRGQSTKQMALELNVSTRAVEIHLTNIYEKLEVKSRSEALIKLMTLLQK